MDAQKTGTAARNRSLVVIAVLLTIATVVVLKLYASSIESKAKEIEDPVHVLAVIAAVGEGEPIGKVAYIEMPRRHLHPDAILNVDPVTKTQNVLLVQGAKASRALGAKQILLWSDVLPKEGREARDTLGSVIATGNRAVTIRADVGSVHGGLLRTGDRVDVLCTVSEPKTGDVITKTLLQNVTVLAVGGQIHAAALGSPRRRSSPNTTLEVSPEDAEILIFAQQKGELSLIVRPSADTTVRELPGKGFWDIFEKPESGDEPALDDLGKRMKAIREELKGIRTVKIERVADKIVVSGVVYKDDEIERVKACATKHSDVIVDKTIANPRATEDLRRKR